MEIKVNKVIITGCAGFIGAMVSKKFLENGISVLGIDNLNNYYDVELKKKRLSYVKKDLKNVEDLWQFHNVSIQEKDNIFDLCEKFLPDIIINLAAQAGVRYSIDKPDIYLNSNIVGTFNVIKIANGNNVNVCAKLIELPKALKSNQTCILATNQLIEEKINICNINFWFLR